MFICMRCLKENFENGESFFKSRGKCEFCKKDSNCNDIPSKELITKNRKN